MADIKEGRAAIGDAEPIIDRLERLRAQHRLAIHGFEGKDSLHNGEAAKHKTFVPENTYYRLFHNGKFGMEKLVKSNSLHLHSMTLVPSPDSCKSVRPFEMHPFGDNLVYLFDLSTDKKDPARVLRVFKGDGITGWESTTKQFHMFKPTEIHGLDALYAGHDKQSLVNAVMKDPSLGGKQLDCLGKMLEADKKPEIMGLNELLVAATPEHIAAIAVPLEEWESAHQPYAKTVAKLTGAMSGLEHAKKGIDLPVVYYHIDGPEQGKCSYLAHGKKECEEVAYSAVRELIRNDSFRAAALYNRERPKSEAMTNFRGHVQRVLGIDLYKYASMFDERSQASSIGM